MTVHDIVQAWLIEHGYDGLRGYDCGCGIDDLMPCDYDCISDCEPGYLYRNNDACLSEENECEGDPSNERCTCFRSEKG